MTPSHKYLGRWLLILTLLSIVGCSPKETGIGKIVISGSNTFGAELGPRYLMEAFRSLHDDVEFHLDAKGSGSGFAALLAGECDIAVSSRPINEDEQREAKARRIKLKEYTFGSYGIAVIVNKANPITGLKPEQVRDVFTGAISNWQQVGGPDAPIRLCIRDPIAGTYLGFQELAMERKPYTGSAKQFNTYPEIVEAIKADKDAVGYAGMSFAAKDVVKALMIDGVYPSVTSVNEHDYPYSRTLRFYTNAANESETARAFIRVVQSSRGQKVLSEAGFVRRSESHWWSDDVD